jgi:hypothetical protein
MLEAFGWGVLAQSSLLLAGLLVCGVSESLAGSALER